MDFEYEIIVNRFNNVNVFRRYKHSGLRFWAYVHPPMTGPAMRQSVGAIGSDFPRSGTARAIDLAIATYTDAPITIRATTDA